jgi:hypothetical protein
MKFLLNLTHVFFLFFVFLQASVNPVAYVGNPRLGTALSLLQTTDDIASKLHEVRWPHHSYKCWYMLRVWCNDFYFIFIFEHILYVGLVTFGGN